MSRLVPSGSGMDGFSSRALEKATRAQESATLTVFEHTVKAQAIRDMDIADSHAVTDATRVALEEEIDLLDYGMRLAAGSPSKAEIVARHSNRLSNSNNRRLQARFGG